MSNDNQVRSQTHILNQLQMNQDQKNKVQLPKMAQSFIDFNIQKTADQKNNNDKKKQQVQNNQNENQQNQQKQQNQIQKLQRQDQIIQQNIHLRLIDQRNRKKKDLFRIDFPKRAKQKTRRKEVKYQSKNRDFAWIFLVDQQRISKNIKAFQKIKILHINHQNRIDYIVPICKNVEQAKKFVQCKNNEQIYFKFIVDYQNSLDLYQMMRQKIRAVQVHMWNTCQNQQEGIQQFSELKQKSKSQKVYSSISTDLQQIISQHEQQIKNFCRFLKRQNDNQIVLASRISSSSPIFVFDDQKHIIKRINCYRKKLYQSKSIPEKKIKQDLLEELKTYFQKRVEEKYKKILIQQVKEKEKEKQDIKIYYDLTLEMIQIEQTQNISTYGWKNNEKMTEFAKKFCLFYTKDNFFHYQINKMLRSTQSSEYNRLIRLPFYQLYNSIKILYDINKKDQISKLTVYRGFYLDQSDYDLKTLQGKYIQILGFASASKDKKIARRFCDRDKPIMFKIYINIMDGILKEYLDHGYLDCVKTNLKTQFKQEEVLLNNLNVYRVLKIHQPNQDQDCTIIQLQYGSVFELLKNQPAVDSYEKKVLNNFNYCAKILQSYQNIIKIRTQVLEKANKVKTNILLKGAQLELQQGNLQFARQLVGKYFLNQQLLNNLKQNSQNKKNLNQMTESQKNKAQEQRIILKKNNEKIIQYAQYIQDLNLIQKGIIYQQELTQDKNWLEKLNLYIKKASYYTLKGESQSSLKFYYEAEKMIQQKLLPYKNRQDNVKGMNCCWKNQLLISQEIQKINIEISKSLSPQIFEQLYKVQIRILESLQFKRDKKGTKKYRQKLQQTKAKIKQMAQALQQEFSLANLSELTIKTSAKYLSQLTGQNQRKSYTINLEKKIKQSVAKQSIFNMSTQVEKMKQQLSQLEFQHCKRVLSGKKLPKSKNENENFQGRGTANSFQNEQNKVSRSDAIEKALKSSNSLKQTVDTIHYSSNSKNFKVRNQISQLLFFQKNFQQAQKLSNEILNSVNGRRHTQGSRASLLLSKVFFEQGEYQVSLHFVQKAEQILKQAIWKKGSNQKQDQNYKKAYQCSRVLYEILLQKVKIYNKCQSLPQIANKQLSQIQNKKVYKIYGVDIQIQALKERANLYLFNKDCYKFQKYMEQAINLIELEYDECHIKRMQYLLYTYINRIKFYQNNPQPIFFWFFSVYRINGQYYLNQAKKICNKLQKFGQETRQNKWMIQYGKATKILKQQNKGQQLINAFKQTLQLLKQIQKQKQKICGIIYQQYKLETLLGLCDAYYKKYFTKKNAKVKITQKDLKQIDFVIEQLNLHIKLIQDQIENSLKMFEKIVGDNRKQCFSEIQDKKKSLLNKIDTNILGNVEEMKQYIKKKTQQINQSSLRNLSSQNMRS